VLLKLSQYKPTLHCKLDVQGPFKDCSKQVPAVQLLLAHSPLATQAAPKRLLPYVQRPPMQVKAPEVGKPVAAVQVELQESPMLFGATQVPTPLVPALQPETTGQVVV